MTSINFLYYIMALLSLNYIYNCAHINANIYILRIGIFVWC